MPDWSRCMAVLWRMACGEMCRRPTPGHFGSATWRSACSRCATAVRVMVVAGDDGAYGSTDKSVFVRQPLHGFVVDGFLVIEPVAHHLEPLAAHVQRHAVGEVAAFGQAHAHDGAAGLQQAEEHRLVGLRA